MQALLERHERSMREAQHELNKMASKVTSLESKATTLKDENSKTINENKSLLASLDDVNKNMLASDMRARDLQEELDVTHVCTPLHIYIIRLTVCRRQSLLAYLQQHHEQRYSKHN